MWMNRMWIGVSAGALLVSAVSAMGAGPQDKKDDKKKEEKVVVAGTPVAPPAEPTSGLDDGGHR